MAKSVEHMRAELRMRKRAEGGSINGDNTDWNDEYAKGGEIKRKKAPRATPEFTTLSRLLGVQMRDVGADEAPDLPVKVYMDPDRGQPMHLPTGGVTMPNGQLLVPGAPPAGAQPPQQPGQGAVPGAPPGVPMGALAMMSGARPGPQPPSNILSMTRQGQAMAAMRPPMPPARMADGGKVENEARLAMEQAARRAGMKAPVTAAKPLTGLQDTQDVLQDRVRERAEAMRQQISKLGHKYDAGQHVFTEWSARNNHPPFKILARTVIGKRGEHPQPGYRVEHMPHGDPDNLMTYDIPEHAILGAVGE